MPKKLCQKIYAKKLIPKIIFQPHENYGQTPLPSVTSFVPTSTPMPSTIPSTTTTTSTMASTIPSTPSPLSSGISFRSLDFFFFGHHRKLPMFDLNRKSKYNWIQNILIMSKHIPLSQYLMGAHLSQVMTVEGLSWIIINLLSSLLPIVTSSTATINNNNNVNNIISNQNTSYPIHYKDQTQQPANHRSILKFKKRIHCLANPQDQQVSIWQTDYPFIADNLVLANFLTNLTSRTIKSAI